MCVSVCLCNDEDGKARTNCERTKEKNKMKRVLINTTQKLCRRAPMHGVCTHFLYSARVGRGVVHVQVCLPSPGATKREGWEGDGEGG